MKIIIIGAGEVGFHIAQRLSEENQDVVLIEKDPNKIREVQNIIDVQAILGSGTNPSALHEAGIKESDIIVAATDSDEANLIACFYAQYLTDYITKIARLKNPEYMKHKEIFDQDFFNIDLIINPQSEMVASILKLTEVPMASEVIDFVNGKIKLIGITIKDNSPLVGQRLSSFNDYSQTILVGVIVRGEKVIIPRGQDTIQPNDLVYCVTNKEEIPNIFRLLNLREEGLSRVIIVGGGETGLALATSLDKTTINTKIIEKDGQRCLELAEKLEKYGVKVIGTSFKALDLAEDRGSFSSLLKELNIPYPEFGVAESADEALERSKKIGFPLLVRPSYVLGGQSMKIVINEEEFLELIKK